MYRKEFLLILILGLGIFFCYYKRESVVSLRENIVDSISQPVVPKEEEKVVVDIIRWEPVRVVSEDGLGVVLADIDSHMPAGHQYRASNKITWAHETTHGINANIRNKVGGKVNGFYVLENRAIVVPEPDVTIGRVAESVPSSWRGSCFNLYLVSQRRDWDRQPLYLCDEWVAYTNGAACRKDLQMADMESEINYTCEFTGYVLVLAYVVKRDCPDYNDNQFRGFLMWSMERIAKINDDESRLSVLRTSSDGSEVRSFARKYFGSNWCKNILGF